MEKLVSLPVLFRDDMGGRLPTLRRQMILDGRVNPCHWILKANGINTYTCSAWAGYRGEQTAARRGCFR